jgi:hypothetical protein
MADVTVVPASVRAVTNDPEDTLTFWAEASYTPALGDLVMVSAADEVDEAVVGAANGVAGVVVAIKKVQNNAGLTRYRVTVLHRGLVDGYTGLTAGELVQNSANAGNTADNAVVANARTVGMVKNATQIFFMCPVI